MNQFRPLILRLLKRHTPRAASFIGKLYQKTNNWLRYGDVHFPKSFSIEISKFCNRTCSYCPNSLIETPKEFMELAVFRKIAQRLRDIRWNGVVDFIFYNEPLLDPRIVDLVKLIKTIVPWCMPRILTNGDPLTPTLAKNLIDAGVVTFWVSRHVPVKPGWDDRMRRLQAMFPGMLTITDLMEVQARQGLQTRAGMVKVEKEYQSDSCHAPSSCQHITIKGDLILCCNDYHREHTFGSLLESPIMDLWRNPTWTAIRTELRYGITRLPICQNCIVRQK